MRTDIRRAAAVVAEFLAPYHGRSLSLLTEIDVPL
jgi:hypothetical protein